MIRSNCLSTALSTSVAGACMLIAAPSLNSASAEVGVQGTVTAVQVSASEAPIAEVLSALEKDFDVRCRASISLDGTISGTYQGSLAQVLSRVLQGYDYILKKEAERLELVIVRRRPNPAESAQPSKSAPGTHTTSDWKRMTERVGQ